MKRKKEASKSPAKDARNGNLDSLYSIMDCNSLTTNDRDAYKWLWAAKDFSSKKVDLIISDLIEVSSLRHDDDGYERALAHWELAIDYLEGGEGLPIDFEYAKKHLRIASRHIDLKDLAQHVIPRLTNEARTTLEVNFTSNNPFNELIRYVNRVNHLRKLDAPKIIVENEKKLLRETFELFLKEDKST